MPSIMLDTKRWTKVAAGPEDESLTVTARGFACYYSNNAEPPELASEGTELGSGSSLTFEVPRWFRAKEPASTEAPFQPSILEVENVLAAGETIDTAMIDNLAITTGKLAASAVTPAKLALITWKAITAKSAELEAAAGYSEVETSALGNGIVEMRGVFKVKAAGSIAAGGKLFSVNAEHKPAKERLTNFAVLKKAKEDKGVFVASINTTGEVFSEHALAEAEFIAFDGVSYSL